MFPSYTDHIKDTVAIVEAELKDIETELDSEIESKEAEIGILKSEIWRHLYGKAPIEQDMGEFAASISRANFEKYIDSYEPVYISCAKTILNAARDKLYKANSEFAKATQNMQDETVGIVIEGDEKSLLDDIWVESGAQSSDTEYDLKKLREAIQKEIGNHFKSLRK